jgi:REP element-mobilizing transposase RayT
MSRLADGHIIPDTYTKLHYHIVFSTRGRHPTIEPEWSARLHEYIGGTIRGLGGHSVIVGGVENHIHILAGLRPSHCLSDVLREIKHESSRWIRGEIRKNFAWQKGYGAFTVSPLGCDRVKAYIENQERHHR